MIPSSTAVSSGFTFSANWRGFELKRNGQSIATLRRPRMWSADFLAESPGESWVIRRNGFWGNKGEILDGASQRRIAVFKSGWGSKGTLTFADGTTYLVLTRGCWHPVWTVATEAGQPVFQLHTREKSVDIQTDLPADRLMVLMLFTLYRVRQAEEAAAAAAVAAS